MAGAGWYHGPASRTAGGALMPRRHQPHSAVANHSMDVQAEVRELRRRAAPMFEAAMATGDWNLVAETKALADTLKAAGTLARRVAGMADAISCPDGVAGAGHGRAA